MNRGVMGSDNAVYASALDRLQRYRGSIWRHRKGGTYAVVLFAIREQDRTIDVVYRDVICDVLYTRPAREFFDGRFSPVSIGAVR